MAFKDPIRRKEYQHQRYLDRKAGILAKNREPQTREKRNEWHRLRRQENGDEVRAYHNEWRKKNAIRVRIIQALGGTCARCGFDDIRALQVDHINGGGMKERQMFKNGYQYEKYVLEHVTEGTYQVLCANCNWIKRDEEQELFKYRKASD